MLAKVLEFYVVSTNPRYKMMKIENAIKLGLAGLFFICLLDMPYGYFQFVRFAALVGFGYLAIQAKKADQETEMFIYIALAILFQPIFKISFGRTLWNLIDVIVGIGLIINVYTDYKKLENET